MSFDPERMEALSVASSALLSAYLMEHNITYNKVLALVATTIALYGVA